MRVVVYSFYGFRRIDGRYRIHGRVNQFKFTCVVVIFLLRRFHCPLFTCSTLQLVSLSRIYTQQHRWTETLSHSYETVPALKLFARPKFRPSNSKFSSFQSARPQFYSLCFLVDFFSFPADAVCI